MGIRGHFPSLLLNSKDLFLLTTYEMLISLFCKVDTYFDFFYFNTSSLPTIILLAHWIYTLTVNKSGFFCLFVFPL